MLCIILFVNNTALMLNENHIKNIENHKYNIIDNSISTSLLKSIWLKMESFIPFCVSPNIITLLGLLSTMIGTYISYMYYDTSQYIATFCALFFTITYINLDAIDGIHARKTKNVSAIGELLDHGCDSISTILLTLMFCKLLNIQNNILIWKCVIISSLVFLTYHCDSLKTYHTFGKYTGPVEILTYFSILTMINIFVPSIVKILLSQFLNLIDPFLFGIIIYTFHMTFNKEMKKHHTVMTWVIKLLLLYIGFRFLFLSPNITLEQIFCDGCAISFVTWEIILNKISKRDSGIIIMFIIFTYYLSGYFGVISSITLIINYIRNIADALNLNIFTQNINVYCCGVYDLCHYGHKIMFKKSLEYGTRLIVGVHNDAVVQSYKRLPIMNMNERIKEVETSKYVSKVVPNALLQITQKELDDLNIHIVVCCEDYYCDDDKWYEVPRKAGILKSISYTNEISTTDIIKRCKKHVV